MLVLVKANVLAVGLNGKTELLKKLPIRVLQMKNGREAGRSLKNENVDSIICTWDLPDAADGRFLKTLRLAKPYVPIIAIVRSNDIRQEIAARSIGVTAVLSSDVTEEVFIRTVSSVLGLSDTESNQKLYVIAND